MNILFNDILQLRFFLTFSSLLFHKDARSEYGGLTIYDDAFKNYLWVKVFGDNVFAIIKSLFFFICLCFNMVSFRGKKKLGPRPDRSLLGVQFKNSDKHPYHVHIWSSPPPRPNVHAYADDTQLYSVFGS